MQKSPIKDKLKKIFASAKGADVIFLRNNFYSDPNFLYITGYTNSLFEDNVLILTRTGAYHIASPLDYESALLDKHPEIKVIKMTRDGAHRKVLKRLLGGKNVGINGSFLTYEVYVALKKNYKPKKIIDVSDAFDLARVIKSEQEIESIRQAVRITKWTMFQVQREFKEGMTERELATKFDSISSALGSQRPPSPTIVCFGKNSALEHHFPDNTKLVDGDFILIDAGAVVNNYCSDISRTFIFGKQDPEKLEIYKVVKEAQVKAMRALKVGTKASDVFKIADDHINQASGGKYKGKFTHALGHSLGIEEHDSTLMLLSPSVDEPLRAGAVITVEPGIYLTGYGGVRVEDDILITDEGPMIL